MEDRSIIVGQYSHNGIFRSCSKATENFVVVEKEDILLSLYSVLTRQRFSFVARAQESPDEVDSCNFQSTTKHFTDATKSTGEEVS